MTLNARAHSSSTDSSPSSSSIPRPRRIAAPSWIAAIGVAFCAVTFSAAAQLPAKVGDTPVPSLAPIVKKAAPAVVNIATRGTVRQRPRNPLLEDPFFRRFFDLPDNLAPRELPFQSAGSGVIVDAKNGYIITNAHVIENADEITVTLLDDRQFKAKVVGRDKPSDVAVLQIEAKNLTEMPLADSSRAEVGDFVLAIGNPFALSHTVTSGIISALGRSDNNPESFQDFIQTDAPINPGNSGGALVNLNGELVGINTAIFSGTGGNIGIGFAIPSNMAKAVMSQLIEYGEVKRGVLGVQLATQFTPEIAESLGLDSAKGALVSQVLEGTAAERAGIKAGDVITAINGKPIANATDLRNSIGMLRVGEKVDIELMRDGKPHRVHATISERGAADAESAADIHAGFAGATLADAPDEGGVLIQNVAPGSPAARNGFRANDVIVAIGRVRIKNLEQLRATLKDVRAFAITIRRGNARIVFTIR